jgi:ATP adenylyltransferase
MTIDKSGTDPPLLLMHHSGREILPIIGKGQTYNHLSDRGGRYVEQLWAPWRMEFVQSSRPETGCLFCTKIRESDDVANLIVHRGPRAFIIMNLYPYNSGHLMVVPYQHVARLPDLHPEASAAVMATAQLAVRALDDLMRPHGYNMGINQGDIAGAGVADHLHLHVVPRWSGDTNFMPVVAGAKVMPELISQTAAKLRPVLERLREES